MQFNIESFRKMLISSKNPKIVQPRAALVFVGSSFATQFGIKKWIESKKIKKMESLQSYISNLEWFQAVNDGNIIPK